MSQKNIDVVRRLFETYSRGDYDAAAACLAPGVVYEVGQEMPAFGPDEVRAMWERWDGAWEDMETVPEEFLDAGEHVVVTVHYSARGRGSGIEYDERLYDVYTIRDGRWSGSSSSSSAPRRSRPQGSAAERPSERLAAWSGWSAPSCT